VELKRTMRSFIQVASYCSFLLTSCFRYQVAGHGAIELNKQAKIVILVSGEASVKGP
jgi:hypothetical protein